MGVPILFQVFSRPLTSAVVCGCTAVWFYIQKHRLSYQDVGVSYEAVVENKQTWRIATAAVSHISLIHLLFNMSAIWSLGRIESTADTVLMPSLKSSTPEHPGELLPFLSFLAPHAEYLKASVILAVASELLALLCYHVLVHYLRIERYRRVSGVGYSCVVFGWMTILSVQQPSTSLNLLGLVSLPVSYAPFESLVMTSFIVPNASFIGHLAGIVVGYFLAWGVFSGFNFYWQGVLYFWLSVAGIHSLKTTGPFQLNWLEIQLLIETDELPNATGTAETLPLLPITNTADIV